MQTTQTELDLPAGKCPVHRFGSEGPVVFVFMDAFGPRPTLFRICERIAGRGFQVLLPDLFYAHAPYAPIEPANLFSGGGDRQRLGAMLGTLDQAALDGDVGALLEYAATLPGAAAGFAAVGYCMGGRFALTAASLEPSLRAAACFHASTLAPEQGESAHARLAGHAGRFYIGTAGIDPTFDAVEAGRLALALREANVDHTIENYVGAPHGFVMDDLPAFNAAAVERHWQRLTLLLQEAFPPAS